MSARHDEFLDLCAGYALGALDPDDETRLRDHRASGCAECEAALVEFGKAVALLGAAEPPVTPPAEVRERLLRSLPARTLPLPTRSRRGVSLALGGALAAAALLAITTFLYRDQATTLRAERDALVEQLAVLQEELGDTERWLAVATNPRSRFGAIAPTPDGDPALAGWVTLETGTGDAVVVLRNAAPPTEQDYELWALRPEGPVSLGVVEAGGDGLAVVRLASLAAPGDIAGFALSLEPAGGSPTGAPTTVVMVGTL